MYKSPGLRQKSEHRLGEFNQVGGVDIIDLEIRQLPHEKHSLTNAFTADFNFSNVRRKHVPHESDLKQCHKCQI